MDMDLLNLLLVAGGTLALPILAFAASFFFWPSALIKVYYWYWRRTLGMQVRYADCGGYRFCYSVRGKPGTRPSVLMLHGFSAHKDLWLSVVKFLPKHLHLLCVDMPGHGGTTRTCTDDYSIQGQVRRLHQFVESIRLNKKPFHLVGSSMGGSVAGVYAACYPTHIFGLTLICPAGLRCPAESRFVKQLQALQRAGVSQGIPLIPSTPQEMDDMLQLCSYVRFKIPQQILQGLVDVRLPHNDFYRDVFMKIVGEDSRHCLHDHMHQITAPLQVIWGKQDQVMDVSGAAVLVEAVPGCQVELLENCGHSVVMERPRKTAKLIMDFICVQQGIDSTSSKKLS
ncbi:monoacylglycerol lipase ABHD6b [Anguilla anguilla]|uniref:monoacylglycerol lipase ABHD6b n=1 Tax=Anguilla anguilla TaxID=7936 RepID=UPI0015A7C490|nr:monoacylglycerol lipase ABHD6b [Anguilla anguilla]XP_035239272.1 monoacylglycerol lipase ABHD6b [Anguilla anguilla]